MSRLWLTISLLGLPSARRRWPAWVMSAIRGGAGPVRLGLAAMIGGLALAGCTASDAPGPMEPATQEADDLRDSEGRQDMEEGMGDDAAREGAGGGRR